MKALRQAPKRIVIECAKCGRHGEHARDSPVRKYGDISLEDFMFRVVAMECALMRHPTAPTACRAHLVAQSRHAA